jgi:hypothetical protein
MPLQEREDFVQQKSETVTSLGSKMERLRVSNESVSSVRSNGSPKKARKLATKKWEGAWMTS